MIPRQDVSSHLDWLRGLIDERIGDAAMTLRQRTLRSAVEYALEGGKRVRPTLVMLACGAVGGEESEALDGAVAVELLHVASLVHDDIMDRSELRRGRATLHMLHDMPTAMLVGDTLTALAFRTIQQLRTPRKETILKLFSMGFVDLCEGQAEDLALGGLGGGDVRSHRAMVERKTARLMEIAAGIGATIGSDQKARIRCLQDFGLQIGMAFQAHDDLLDAMGDSEIVGKSVGVDARNGRQTYLTVAQPNVDTIEGIRTLAAEHTEAACAALRTLEPSPAQTCLVELARSLLTRSH